MIKVISKENPIIKLTSSLIVSAKKRRECGQFVIEGLRICEDAYKSNVKINILIVSDEINEKYRDLSAKLELASDDSICVSKNLFDKIADTKSPQGIMCVCSTSSLPHCEIKKFAKYIALENVQDPSNMGTIIRTAEALGVDGVLLSKNCCDLLNPKVVRGSMGGVFRLPSLIVESDFSGYIHKLSLSGYFTCATVVNEQAESILNVDYSNGVIAVIGNEANGVTKSTIDGCCKAITIPMNGKAESLNAAMAAGIVMWEIIK